MIEESRNNVGALVWTVAGCDAEMTIKEDGGIYTLFYEPLFDGLQILGVDDEESALEKALTMIDQAILEMHSFFTSAREELHARDGQHYFEPDLSPGEDTFNGEEC